MRKSLLYVLVALLAAFSCAKSNKAYFSALDRALDSQDVYDLRQTHLQDSLRLCAHKASTDSAKWEALYALERILFYRDIDSCYHSVREMLRLCGDDYRQKTISQCSYANILYKMDSIQTALSSFRQIDTVGIDGEALNLYCFAGYHIYGRVSGSSPENEALQREIVEKWWKRDSTRIECAYYHNQLLRRNGEENDALASLRACVLASPNDTAKANYYLAKEYLHLGETENAIRFYAKSVECDMRLAVKAYNALYELALTLFRTGDIERADRYMRITLKDAYSSHYESRYDDVILSELEIMNVLLEQQKQKRRAVLITAVAIALLLAIAVLSLFLLNAYSSRLAISRKQLSEASKIKDNFLAMYMEKCVDYLNKVDEYRSSLRHTAKLEGPDAIMAMLRKPSFAAGEFDGLLASLDSTFLGIFPDFVDKVNAHMQEQYRLTMPAKGTLSTELRILALIKIGISKRQKIAKILNMSVTTVYSYHCNLQKHSLHPDDSFDRIIAGL